MGGSLGSRKSLNSIVVRGGTHCEEGTFLISRYLVDTVDCQPGPHQIARYTNCPLQTVLEVLANKWTLVVMVTLRRREDPIRFNELQRTLDGITQKMLTQTLRTLERDGLVSRTMYPTVPPRVEYALTELGVGAGRVLNDVGEWSEQHIDRILTSREGFDVRAAREPQPVRL
jgi:DNA-binding HxlR family transcriptional regulator